MAIMLENCQNIKMFHRSRCLGFEYPHYLLLLTQVPQTMEETYCVEHFQPHKYIGLLCFMFSIHKIWSKSLYASQLLLCQYIMEQILL